MTKSWLLREGYSEKASDKFIEGGWAPSFFMQGTGTKRRISGMGIAALDFEFSET